MTLVRDVRQQSDLTGTLDGLGQHTLMLGAGTGGALGQDLGTLGHVLTQLCNILVIDIVYLVLAEDANLLSSVIRTKGGTLCIVSIHCR